MEEGYTTEFHLKRNMMDNEFAKKSTGGTGGAGQHAGANSTDDGDDDGDAAAGDDEEEEDEDGPEFCSLMWKKDGKEVSEALIDDDVTLFCEVKNIDEGERVKFHIYEHDEDGEHDYICELEGEVRDSRVEAPWKVVYKEDDESSVAEELEEKGWAVPDYYFVARYGGVESEGSKPLDAKGWVKIIVKHKDNGEIQANKKYTMHLPDNSTRKGQTDAEGAIYERKLPDGFRYITFED
jgi:hypothetical protein